MLKIEITTRTPYTQLNCIIQQEQQHLQYNLKVILFRSLHTITFQQHSNVSRNLQHVIQNELRHYKLIELNMKR